MKKILFCLLLGAIGAYGQPAPFVRATSTNGTITLFPASGQGIVDFEDANASSGTNFFVSGTNINVITTSGGGKATNTINISSVITNVVVTNSTFYGNGAGLTNLNAPSSNSIYVSLAGADLPGYGTNLMAPCLSMTNATNIAANLGGTNCIFVAPGIYQIPDFFTVLTNVTIVGSGPNITVLEAPVKQTVFEVVIGGDNAGVNDLTITMTNLNTTNYMPPLSFTNHATNVVCKNLWIYGNSDALDAYSTFSLKNLVTATFDSPHFDSRWDLRILEADNAAGQASVLTFNNGYFYSHMASSQLLVGTSHDIDNKGITIIDNNCVTYMTNVAANAMMGAYTETATSTNFHNNSSYSFFPSANASICSDQTDTGFNVFTGTAPDPGLCDVEPWNGGQQATFPHGMFDVLTVNSFTNVGALQSDYNADGNPAFYSDGSGSVHANTFSTTGTQASGSQFIGNGSGLTNLSLSGNPPFSTTHQFFTTVGVAYTNNTSKRGFFSIPFSWTTGSGTGWGANCYITNYSATGVADVTSYSMGSGGLTALIQTGSNTFTGFLYSNSVVNVVATVGTITALNTTNNQSNINWQ